MRQRSLTRRICTALFGLWFCLLVAEPVPMHVCPMHDAPLTTAAVPHAMVMHAMSDAPTAMADKHDATQAHDASSSDGQSGHGSHQCLCLGCCAGTSAVSVPAAPVFNVQAALDTMQVHRIDAREVLPSAPRFAFALPFANGPPAASRLLS